jgi:FtsH-binding integral membrane protein
MYGRAQITRLKLRTYFMLTLGWILTLVGIVVTPMPIPIPLIGLLPLMAGLAILIHYSRRMRRLIQRVRHRVRWISYMLEHFAHRAPKKIAAILARSHPRSIERHARIQARSPSDVEGKS